MKRYMVIDGAGRAQWMETCANDEYISAPAYVTKKIRTGQWKLVQDTIAEAPPEVAEDWVRPDWRAVAGDLSVALYTICNHPNFSIEDEELAGLAQAALDSYQTALMAHEEAVVPAAPPEPPGGFMADDVATAEDDEDNDDTDEQRYG